MLIPNEYPFDDEAGKGRPPGTFFFSDSLRPAVQ
jgi:hypothetical protein